MNMRVECPEFVNMAEVDDLRRELMRGVNHVTDEELEVTCKTSIVALHKVHWNDLNEQRFGRKPVPIDQVVFPPALPPVPKPYRSWPEVQISRFGGLKGLEYEPKSHKVKYVIEHTYQPDWVDEVNDRIFYEAKGVIPTLADAAKYRAVVKSNGVHFVFIFQEKGIICPFARPRANGTRMTLEEWATKEGFDYCYLGEEGEFRKSARYKWLVENVGKFLPSLQEALRTNNK